MSPLQVLNTYLKLIDDQNQRVSLATKTKCHNLAIEVRKLLNSGWTFFTAIFIKNVMPFFSHLDRFVFCATTSQMSQLGNFGLNFLCVLFVSVSVLILALILHPSSPPVG